MTDLQLPPERDVSPERQDAMHDAVRRRIARRRPRIAGRI